LKAAAPPPLAPIPASELEKYSPEQRATFAAALAKAGFDKSEVQTKIAPPSEPAAKPVAVIEGASPDGYRLTYSREVLASPDLPKTDVAIRTALSTAEVPVGLSQSLMDTIASTARTFAGLNEDQQAAKAASEGKVLIKTYGKERATELGALAEVALQRLGPDFLSHAGPFGGHSAQSIVTLAGIERSYRQKKGT